MSILSRTLLPEPEAPMTVMVSPRTKSRRQVAEDDLGPEGLLDALEADRAGSPGAARRGA